MAVSPATIAACEGFAYRLPLTGPLSVGNGVIQSRQGLIIRLTDPAGHYGYGEAAPLPYFHQEDLATVRRVFIAVQPALTGQPLPPGLERLQGGFERWLGRFRLPPSLRCGLETAVLNLLASVRGLSLAALLAPSCWKKLPVNGLLTSGPMVAKQAQDLAAEGYTAVKLKVGRQEVAQDIAAVRAVCQVLGGRCALRLDANRRWDLATAVQFGQAIADGGIEYIEEPVAEGTLIAAFHQATGLPVALDESLTEQPVTAPYLASGVQALVLKPALLGGLERTQALIHFARQRGIRTVISSVFESGVGLAALASSAAALCAQRIPAGLDTYRWLAEDLPEIPFAATHGLVDVEEAHQHARQLRWSLLAKII